jgi:hypothetical protein
MLDRPACALHDLPCPFSCTNHNILATFTGSFANRTDCVDRMQGYQISCTFSDTFGRISHTSRGTFSDIAASTSDIAFGAPALRLRSRLGGRRRTLARRGGRCSLLAVCD